VYVPLNSNRCDPTFGVTAPGGDGEAPMSEQKGEGRASLPTSFN
jgi:hypothetical protein